MILHDCWCEDTWPFPTAQGSHVFSNPKNISCMWSICTDICTEMSGNFHYTSPISWSQIWHGGSAHFWRVLLRPSGFSIRFPAFPPSPLVWSSSSSITSSDINCADECWPSYSWVTMTLISLSFAKSGGASAVRWFDPDRFPNLVYITSDFRRRESGVYALHALLILVYAIRWHARQCFVIFGCHIIPVLLSSNTTLRLFSWQCDDIALRCHYLLEHKHSGIAFVCPIHLLKWGKFGYKRLGFCPLLLILSISISAGTPCSKKTDFSSRTVADTSWCARWCHTVKRVGPQSIVTIIGYVHAKLIPVVSHFYFPFSHWAGAESID